MNTNLYAPKQKKEVSCTVNARQKEFLSSVEVYIPNIPYEKLREGHELSDPDSRASNIGATPQTSEEDKLERTRRRAYSAIRDYALSNAFELFATFTFREDRQNAERCRQKLNGWLKRTRRGDKEFQYIVVPELHKDRESLHFHALMKGYRGELVRAINPKTGKPLTKRRRAVYDFPSYTLGHSEVYTIGDTKDDRIRSSRYLLKYVKKEMLELKSKKRYWVSRGLDKPKITENPERWYLKVEPDHLQTAEYGIYLYFDRDEVKEYV